MPEKVRVGVVGTSWFTETFHILPLKSRPGAEVVAVCGRREDYTQEIARKHAIPHAFTDYEAMIRNANLDAVVVSAPDDLHYSMTMTALEAGKHVLCEKPLALNAAQAREMAECAEAKGVVHLTDFSNRWAPHYQFIKELIQEGYTGKPYHSHFNFIMGYGRDGQYAWRFDPQRSNGILGDMGSHMIDLARWLVGEIEWVSASLGTHIERQGPQGGTIDPANDTALLKLGFADGSQGSILASSMSHVADRIGEQAVSIYGQAGSLECIWSYGGEGNGAHLSGARSTEEHFAILPIPEHPLDPQPNADRLFIDAILEGRQVTPDFTDGLRAMEVIEAAIESDRTGRRVFIHGGSE